LYLVYSSTVMAPYVRNDGLRYFDKYYNRNSNFTTDPQFKWLCALGRPVAALEEAFIYQKINHLSDLSRLRLLTITVFALNASLLSSIVVALGLPVIPAFCMSIVIFTLPGIQECVFVPFLFIALAQLCSLSAYVIWMSRWVFGLRIILSFLLLEIAFFTYVPSTFFFLIPVTFLLILKEDDWPHAKKVWLRDMIFGILAAAVYLCVIRIFFYKYIELSGHQIKWDSVLNNIKTFLPQAVPQSFNLWNIYYSKVLGITIGLFVAGVLLANALFSKKNIALQRISALLGIFVIFNMVWILLGGYLPRTFVASQALVLLLVYWSGDWLLRMLKSNKWANESWPIILLALGLIFANIMTTRNVWNCNAELMFIRSRIAQYENSYIREIHIIRPQDTTRGYNGLSIVYDNFNDGSTGQTELTGLIRAALKDLDDPPIEMHCMVTSSNYGEPFTMGPNVILIDMNDLVRISKKTGTH